MKVAVALTDQSFTRTKSMGIFNVSMGLVRGLMRHPDITELHILGNNECGGEFPNLPPHVHLHLADKPVPRRFGRVWWDQFGLSAVVRKIAPDWLILPKGVPPLFPMLGKTKLACYVHDVMWEHYEQRPIGDRPKAFPLHEFIYFKNLSLHAMRIADVVLTHTQFNADRIRHYVPQARIYRIGIGFDSPASPRNADEATDILTYGSTFPHKRLDLTLSRITAWLNQRPDGNNIRVHIVGSLPKDCILPDERWIHHKRIPYPELCRLMQEKCRMAVYFRTMRVMACPRWNACSTESPAYHRIFLLFEKIFLNSIWYPMKMKKPSSGQLKTSTTKQSLSLLLPSPLGRGLRMTAYVLSNSRNKDLLYTKLHIFSFFTKKSLQCIC